MSAVRLGVTRNQRDLWAAEWRATDRRMHTVAQHVEIRGPLELTAFEDAMRQVLAETEAVRARFRDDGGEVIQEILPSVRWRLAVIDLSGHSDPAAAFDEWAEADQRAPILASDFPLFSTALLRLGSDHHRWSLRFHHMAMDAFSAALLLRRVADVYAARSTGGDAGPSPFRPIAALHEEQREYEESDRFAADRAFWRERLTGLPGPVRITPSDVADSRVLAGVGLAPPPAGQICRTADAAGTAWPDVVLAVVAAHAAAESGASDVVMTVPVSNRTTAVSRSVPTNTANRIMLAVPVRPEASFHELLTAVTADNREAVRHQIFPHSVVMADLGERAAPHRSSGPWVNIMPFGADLALPGCTTSVHRVQTGPVGDLEVAVYGDPDAARMRVNVLMGLRPEHHALLLAAERRLMDRFAAVTADPHRPLAELPEFAAAWAPAR
ncbi:condensation domain-containing protein [Lentzea tibetensis]|uniref:condensation domain-containing protein n=1 Tax=Lentzea tibetensis TaxID=2591470 RepID=UPI0016446B2D|nr:condensation domain-containing protein [Lentzea tibetensis]